MKQEIGGEFPLAFSSLFKKRLDQFDRLLVGHRFFFAASGRDSLRLILRALRLTGNDEVLLPAYLCADVVHPFKTEGIKYSFYRVKDDLTADVDDISMRRITQNTRAIMIIHYFGYPQPLEKLRQICEAHSLYLIEDTVQAFLTQSTGRYLGSAGDIAFNSFRKFLPVLDGSLLLVNNEKLVTTIMETPPSPKHFIYLCLRFPGMVGKNIYLNTRLIPKPLFLWLFHLADSTLDSFSQPTAISDCSRRMLAQTDYNEISTTRRNNYLRLLEKWHFKIARPLFTSLPDGVCPLGFPVIADNRDHIKQEMIKRKIYPPVHWELPLQIDDCEFRNSWEIARHILTIPIDQRYGPRDMDYILKQMEEIETEG